MTVCSKDAARITLVILAKCGVQLLTRVAKKDTVLLLAVYVDLQFQTAIKRAIMEVLIFLALKEL